MREIEVFPGSFPTLSDPPCRVSLRTLPPRPPRPPLWRLRARREWARRYMPRARFALRVTTAAGDVLMDADDYTLYLVLLYSGRGDA